MAGGGTRPVREALKIVLLAGLVLLFFCILYRNRWPERYQIRADCLGDPVQTAGGVPPPFEVEKNGYTYVVRPLYGYELWGMIVSYHHAGSFIDIAHKMWRDYINIKDVCVIWGRNLETEAFRKMAFRNRDFTCYYSAPDAETASLFSGAHISNNHLVCASPRLVRLIKGARKGDQIHFKGWLASYGHKGSTVGRSTSTTRDDTGDHACETVWVTDFEVLERANPGWRRAFPLSLGIITLSGLLLLAV